MESLSNQKDVKSIPFTIHWPFILRLYIEKCYEDICESDIPHKYVKEKYYDKDAEEMVEYTYDFIEGTRNQLQAKCDVYPLHNVINLYQNMNDEDLMNELEKYMCELYPDAENITVEIEDIRNFAKYVYDKYKLTEEYAEARLENMLRLHTMYVFDKSSKLFEFVKMGAHFATIQKITSKYLLKNVDNLKDFEKSYLEFNCVPKSLYQIADQFISENIIMKGNYNCKESYQFERKQ